MYLDCYVRVSTKSQVIEGHSLNTQKRHGQKVAKRLGLQYRERDEGAKSSQNKNSRIVLQEIEELISKGEIKHIWVVDHDRLFRNQIEMSLFVTNYLKKYGVKLYSGENGNEVKFDTPEQQMLLDLVHRFAQFENEKRRERSVRGKISLLDQFASDKPIFLGQTPTFGYMTVNKLWTINPDESKWVKFIFNEYAKGRSVKEIKLILDQNVSPRRRKTWGLATLIGMLNNSHYTGLLSVHFKELNKTFEYKIPQIINHSLFSRVQKKLIHNKVHASKNSKHKTLLGDLLVCSCGSSMGSRVKVGVRKNGSKYDFQKYYCLSKIQDWKEGVNRNCKNERTITIQELDNIVLQKVIDIVSDSHVLKERFKQDVMNQKKKQLKNLTTEQIKFEKKIAKTQESIDYVDTVIAGIETDKILKRKPVKQTNILLKNLEDERRSLRKDYDYFKQQIDDLDSQKYWVDWVGKYSENIVSLKSSFDKKKEFLSGVLDSIVISGVNGKNREEKNIQIGHNVELNFKLKIVGDEFIKKLGKDGQSYIVKEGKSSDTINIELNRKVSPKKKR